MTSQASYTITAVKDGNDLDSILMLWKKTSTNAAPAKPSGTNLNGWTEDMPEFESGAYVWTCNRVAISDPTAATPIYTYTDPVLDTHWKKLDEVYKQGTEIKNTVDNITLKYFNSNGEETSFKLTNGSIDITLLKNQVDAAATTATNFISMRSDGGIEVGNKSGGSWTGYRSQMLADSYNILDESGTKLSSFSAYRISLGKNDETNTSSISLCGDNAVFEYNSTSNNMTLYAEDFIINTAGGSTSIYSDLVDPSNNTTAISQVKTYAGTVILDARTVESSTGNRSIGAEIMLDETGHVDIRADNYIYMNTPYFDLNGNVDLTGSLTTDRYASIGGNLTVGGKIRGQSSGGSWYRGRNNALLASTSGTGTSEYYPVIDTKCNTGDWSIGTLDDYLCFVYTSDANYSSDTNTVTRVTIDSNGSITAPDFSGRVFTQMKNGKRVAVHGDSYWDEIVFGDGSYQYEEGNVFLRGNAVYADSRGAVSVRPYWGKDENPNSTYMVFGSVNTSFGICLRPGWNDTCTIGANGIGFKYYYGTNTGIQNTSDRRLKENISDDFSKLEKAFKMLRPVTYDYKHLENDDNMRIGFIAQEVWETLEVCGIDPYRFAAIHMEKVDPETDIAKYLDTDETYYLNYTEFTALNTYMIQKLMKRIEELEKRIA